MANFDPGYEPDWAVISTVKREQERDRVPVRETGRPIALTTTKALLVVAMIFLSTDRTATVLPRATEGK